MFKENKKLFYLLGGLMVMITVLNYFLPRPTDLSRNYLRKDKSHFGCYALYNVMQESFSEKVTVNDQTFYNLNIKQETNRSLIIINDKIEFNKNDISALYDFLRRGNTVFLAANDFNGPLSDSLHLKTSRGFWDFSQPFDSLLSSHGFDLRFYSKGLKQVDHQYPKLSRANYFTHFDSTRFAVTAIYDKNKACLIKTKINSGTLYVMSIPDIFGNYFIVNHENRQVAYNCLSMIKNEELIWDEYYKSFRVKNNSPLKFIIESDALYAAYLLLIFSLVVYMIFEGRRRQRAIPIVAAAQNTTLEFINVISHVYYNSKSHKSIAIEKIKYFYETVRKKFNVNTTEMHDRFFEELHDLSGVDKKILRQLFAYCERIKSSGEISEYELLELNRQIENFNKNSLR